MIRRRRGRIRRNGVPKGTCTEGPAGLEGLTGGREMKGWVVGALQAMVRGVNFST